MLEPLIALHPEIANSYCVNALLVWRDYEDRSRTFAREKIFWDKTPERVYSYIKYYCLAFGMCALEIKGEGWGNVDTPPQKEKHNEENKESTTQKTVSARTNKKKSRKKR